MTPIPAVNCGDLYKRDERYVDPKQVLAMLGIECDDWIWIASSLSALKGRLQDVWPVHIAAVFGRLLESDLVLQNELSSTGSFHDIACCVRIEYGSILVVESDLAVMPL